MILYGICLCLIYFIWQSLGPSVLLLMTLFHSFLWLSDVRLYIGLPWKLSDKEHTSQFRRHRSLGWEDPQEDTAIHSSILAWEIPWTEEAGGLYSPWGCKESDMTDWTPSTNTHTYTHKAHLLVVFIRSSVDGHLGCYHILPVINRAVMNPGMHVSFQTRFFIFSRYHIIFFIPL